MIDKEADAAGPNYALATALAVISLGVYLIASDGKPTAFEWGAVELGPFLERYRDPTFLPNDFFTNTYAHANPKYTWAYFVVLASALVRGDWYACFFFLKTAFVLLIPAAAFLGLSGIIRQHLDTETKRTRSEVILCAFMLLLLWPAVSRLFSVAWWRPVDFEVIGATLSFILSFLGIAVTTHVSSAYRHAAAGLWFTSTLIHPQTSLYLFLFYGLAVINKARIRELLVQCATSVVAPLILMILLFPSNTRLSAPEFVRLYAVEGLPWHYLPSHFGSMTPYPWWASYVLVNGLLLAPLIYSVIRKRTGLARLSTLFFLVYASSILLQYVFVEVMPMRMVAILGPSRMTMLGYWMVAVLYTLCAAEARDGSAWDRIARRVPPLAPKMRAVYAILVLSVAAALVSVFLKDDPYARISGTRPALYAWIGERTDANSVFVAYQDGFMVFSIPLITKRAIFVGNGFPVNEEFLEEYIERRQMVYGSLAELDRLRGYWPNGRFNNHYRGLTPTNFITISRRYRLDYVIVEKGHADKFRDIKPAFADETSTVYAIGDMIEACDKAAGSASDR